MGVKHGLFQVLRRLRQLPRDESGQSAFFAVITLMLLVIVLLYTWNVGVTVSERVRLQNAADAAAYSGAVVEANALAGIAWLNSCETYLHSKMQEHMLDVVVYTTASSIINWGRYNYQQYNATSDRDAYRFMPFPFWIPLPIPGGGPQDHYGGFSNLTTNPGANGMPPWGEFAASGEYGVTMPGGMGSTFITRMTDKYGVTINSCQSTLDVTKNYVLRDAKYWIADNQTKLRRGEMWMRQLSIVAAAIARSIPNLVRNEVVYHVQQMAPAETKIAILPDPGGSLNSIPWITDPVLAATDAQIGSASNPSSYYSMFRYEYYLQDAENNRFLVESRRQAKRQKFVHVKDEYPYKFREPYTIWWDEVAGTVKDGGKEYWKAFTCWNGKDRERTVPDAQACSLGYAPGRTIGSLLCGSTLSGDAPDADKCADGHWHAEHWHSHSENCSWTHGGLCLGLPWGLWCYPACFLMSVAGNFDHHMKVANHQEMKHWDGYAKDDSDPVRHVYCETVPDNHIFDGEGGATARSGGSTGRTGSTGGTGTTGGGGGGASAALGDWLVDQFGLESQYPDIVPGLVGTRSAGLPRLCLLCRTMQVYIFIPAPVFIGWICTCANCSRSGFHGTSGCVPAGFLYEWFPLNPFWFFQRLNWPAYKSWPGHLWIEADWEARWSGDKYFYDLGFMIDNAPPLPGGSLGEIGEFMMDFMGMLKNWIGRRSHHMIMNCPMCHKDCSVCGEKHWGKDMGPKQFFFDPVAQARSYLDNMSVTDMITGIVGDLFKGIVKSMMDSLVSSIQNSVGNAITDAIVSPLGPAGGIIKPIVQPLVDSVVGAVTTPIVDAINDFTSDFIDWLVANTVGQVAQFGDDLVDNLANLLPETLPPPQSDTGLSYYHVLLGHDNSSSFRAGGVDCHLGLNINQGDTGSWQANFSCDRFVRQWSAPRNPATLQPDPNFTPAVIATENFFRYGVSVALWAPHRTIFHNAFKVRSGYVAVATARVGYVDNGIIYTGADDKLNATVRWTLDDMWDHFLAFPCSRTTKESNTYWPSWGAKLVSTKYAILGNNAGRLSSSSVRMKTLNGGGNRRYWFNSAAALTSIENPERAFWTYLGTTPCYSSTGERLNTTTFGSLVETSTSWNDFVGDYLESKKRTEAMTP